MHYCFLILVISSLVYIPNGNPLTNEVVDQSSEVRRNILNNTTILVIRNRKETKASTYIQHKILFGSIASEEEFPFLALLYIKTQYTERTPSICGAAIISNVWVLTAGHCLEGPTTNIDVIVGVINRNRIRRQNRRKAAYTIIHDDYDDEDLENDIGAIKVGKPFKFNKNVKPVSLPVDKYVMKSGTPGITMGWGVTEHKTVTPYLRKLYVDILDAQSCFKKEFTRHPRSYVCSINIRTGACNGDSGGPLVTKNETLLVGLVSHGPSRCGRIGTAVKYSSIVYYRKWIKKVTGL